MYKNVFFLLSFENVYYTCIHNATETAQVFKKRSEINGKRREKNTTTTTTARNRLKQHSNKSHYAHFADPRRITDSIWTHHVAECMYLIFKYDVKIMHYCICLNVYRWCCAWLFSLCWLLLLFRLFVYLPSVQNSLPFFRQSVKRSVFLCLFQFIFPSPTAFFTCVSLLIKVNVRKIWVELRTK